MEDLLTVVAYEPELRNQAILTLLWDLDARNHEDTLELDIEAIAGGDKNRESFLTNPPFSVVPDTDLTIARSSKYNYSDHGMEWNNSGKTIVNLSILHNIDGTEVLPMCFNLYISMSQLEIFFKSTWDIVARCSTDMCSNTVYCINEIRQLRLG